MHFNFTIQLHHNVIAISMIVFLILNFIENIIHFSIGRNTDSKDTANIKIELPETYDIIKIVFTMIVFSILQALFTYYGLKYA
jgi:hypothetical protein